MIVRRNNQQQQQQAQRNGAAGLFRSATGGVVSLSSTHLVDAAVEGSMFRGGNDNHETRKRRCVVLAVAVVVGIMVVSLEVFRTKNKFKVVSPVARNDPSIVNSSSRRPNRNYLVKTECQYFAPGNFTTNAATTVPWTPIGEELQRHIKEADLANKDGPAWTKRFGYGTAVAMSGDGHRLIVAYEGTAGFDKAFGAHIDVYQFQIIPHHRYELQQTLSDVSRFHGHDDHRVTFESVAMSRDGNRLAFSDGHGIHVYEFEKDYHPTGTDKKEHYQAKRAGPWMKMDTQINVKLKNSTAVERKRNFAGEQLVMNCDGTVIALSGRRQQASGAKVTFAHIFHLEIRNDIQRVGYDWADLGEIDSVTHGGGIALAASGKRLAVGSIADDMYKGGVRVYDYDDTTNKWHQVGAVILGEKDMEQSGGQVALNADGTILAVADREGSYGRVAMYHLVTDDVSGVVMWEKLGQDLRGSNNVHEHFGADIGLSDDGRVLAVGAPGDRLLYNEYIDGKDSRLVPSENQQYFRGRIYMYRLGTDGNWMRVDNGELQIDGDGVDGDMFGKSVALSSNGVWVVGGAPKRQGSKTILHVHGAAQVFRATL